MLQGACTHWFELRQRCDILCDELEVVATVDNIEYTWHKCGEQRSSLSRISSIVRHDSRKSLGPNLAHDLYRVTVVDRI